MNSKKALLCGWMCMAAVALSAVATENKPGPVGLVLPEVVNAVPGIETNLYLENLVAILNPADYAFDVTCEKGSQQSERWTFTPKPEEVGQYPLRVDVLDATNTVIASASTVVRVAPTDAGADQDVSLLCIGDSLTHMSAYTQHLLDLCAQPRNPRLSLVGTNGPANTPGLNRHEGYGGWTAGHFVTHYTGKARGGEYKERGSPFLYPGENGAPMLDFAQYCRDVNNGKAPDFITIFLGPNDTALKNDDTIEATLDQMMGYLDLMVENIHQFAPETRIGIMPPTPPCASQDGFGAAYGCLIHRWQYLRNVHRTAERMIEHFGGRESEQLYIVPAFANLDTVHGFPTVAAPISARSAEQASRYADAVHPNPGGCQQLGDAIYTWMKRLLAKPQEAAPAAS